MQEISIDLIIVLSVFYKLVTVCSTFFLSYLLGFLLHVFIEVPFLLLLKRLFKVDWKIERNVKNRAIELGTN